MTESPQQLLLRKAQQYIAEERLLQAIAQSAQPVEGGYLIPSELLDRIKQALAA